MILMKQVLCSAPRRRSQVLLLLSSLCTFISLLLLYQGPINEIEMCPLYSPSLKGHLNVTPFRPWSELESELEWVTPGGCWHPSPDDCWPQQKVLVVIAFRDRDDHLPRLLQHLHPFLRSQLLHYCILVISQSWDATPFNRGMLFNAGFDQGFSNGKHKHGSDMPEQRVTHDDGYPIEDYDGIADHSDSRLWMADDTFHPDCIIFHDVDMMPLNDFNLYNCTPGKPKHLSVAIDIFNYTLPYPSFIGGVNSLAVDDFLALNGFSNLFGEFGGEYDDLWKRIEMNNLTVTRETETIGRFTMLREKESSKEGHRFRRVDEGHYFLTTDGLSNLKYEVLARERRRLYTNVTVSLDMVRPKASQVTPKSWKWPWTLLRNIANY